VQLRLVVRAKHNLNKSRVQSDCELPHTLRTRKFSPERTKYVGQPEASHTIPVLKSFFIVINFSLTVF